MNVELVSRVENATFRLVPVVRHWKRLPSPLASLAEAVRKDAPGVGIIGTDDGRVLVVMTAESFLAIAKGASP